MAIPTIATPEEFKAAIASERAVLHFDVDWAVQAVQSRPVVKQFQDAIEGDARLGNVALRRIDCTEQQGELWDFLGRWFIAQRADDTVMVTGGGAVVWVKGGKVRDAVLSAAECGVDGLVERTRKAFEENPRSSQPALRGGRSEQD